MLPRCIGASRSGAGHTGVVPMTSSGATVTVGVGVGDAAPDAVDPALTSAGHPSAHTAATTSHRSRRFVIAASALFQQPRLV